MIFFHLESLKEKIFGDKILAEQVVRHHIVPNIGELFNIFILYIR